MGGSCSILGSAVVAPLPQKQAFEELIQVSPQISIVATVPVDDVLKLDEGHVKLEKNEPYTYSPYYMFNDIHIVRWFI